MNSELQLQSYRPQKSPKRRVTVATVVAVVHIVAVLGPLAYLMLDNRLHPKESAFKVKLMGELSTGPEVGSPQRRPPSPTPGPNPPSPTPPTPAPPTPAPPTPAPPTPAPPKPKPAPPKPKPPKPKPPKPKQPSPAKPKPAKKKPTPKKPVKPVKPESTLPQDDWRKKFRPNRDTRQSRPNSVADAQNQVYQPSGGGSNTNKMVPIGSRDLAQRFGPQNNATPGGGGSDDDNAEYGNRVGNFLKLRWSIPPRSLLGSDEPQVLIELSIASDGRINSARIVRRSGNSAMDTSVAVMLKGLERVPPPPKGRAVTLQLIMLPEM